MSADHVAERRDNIVNTFNAFLQSGNMLQFAETLTQNFNRSRTSETPTSRKSRASRTTSTNSGTISRVITCLGSPDTTFIYPHIVVHLNTVGLGHAPCGVARLPLFMTADDFRSFLEQQFPKLQGQEFELMKAGPDRKLVAFPPDVKCPMDLKMHGGLKRSKLYIRPKKELCAKFTKRAKGFQTTEVSTNDLHGFVPAPSAVGNSADVDMFDTLATVQMTATPQIHMNTSTTPQASGFPTTPVSTNGFRPSVPAASAVGNGTAIQMTATPEIHTNIGITPGASGFPTTQVSTNGFRPSVPAASAVGSSAAVQMTATRQICMVCGTTRTSGSCLRCEIDRDLQESQRIDRQRSQEQRLTSGDGYDAWMMTVRQHRRRCLSSEPLAGFQLRCRLPDNAFAVRRFQPEQPFLDLVNFVGSRPDSTYDFHLKQPLAGFMTISSKYTSYSAPLASLGLTHSMSVDIVWDDERFDIGIEPSREHDEVLLENAIETDNAEDVVLADIDVHNLDRPLKLVTIRNGRVFDDILAAFGEDSVADYSLSFRLEGEDAQDAGGVAKEAIVRFLKQMRTKYGQGMQTKILVVGLVMKALQWQAVGRVLGKCLADYDFLPIWLNRAFEVGCICGCDAVGETELMAAVLADLSQYDNALCEKAENGTMTPREEGHFCDLMQAYEANNVPKKGGVKAKLLEIEETRFLQRSHFVIENIHLGFKSVSKTIKTPGSVLEIFEKHIPCIDSVLQLFENVHPVDNGEILTLQHLKQYIRTLSSLTALQQFVRLLTGANAITVKNIVVTFVAEDKPVFFRTCGPVLEMPKYKTMEKLTSVFDEILKEETFGFNQL